MLRISHVCNYAPGLSGMYGSVRELYFAEQKLGLDVGIVDDSDGKKVYGEYGIDGVIPQPLSFCEQADIICWHHASSDDWFNEPHRNVVMWLHGTPEFNLATEIHNHDNVLSLTIGAAAHKACRAFVTMWRRHLPIWESLLKTRVDYIPCWVDLDAFKVTERQTDPNVIRIALVDYWRLTREPFGLFMAIDRLRQHCGSRKLQVDVWGLPNKPDKTWQAVIQWLVEDDTVTLKGCTADPMKDVYHQVDMVLTMSTEETRVVREAQACGVPVVLGRHVPSVSDYSADCVEPAALARQLFRCHNDLIANGSAIRRRLRAHAEAEFNPARAAVAAKELFERVVDTHGSVNRLRHTVNGKRMVAPVLETANTIRDRLLAHEPVVYTRFGDGELLLMDGHAGWEQNAACPMKNSPGLQAELVECFKGDWPGYLIGCAAGQENEGRMRRGLFASFECNAELVKIVERLAPGRTYANFIALAYQSVFNTDWFIDFLNRCIRPRRVAMLCNETVAASKLVQRLFNVRHFIVIPAAEAYKSIAAIEAETLKAVEDNDVILSAAGPISNVLAVRLCKQGFTAKGKAFIDIGSIGDALAGSSSRGWIRQLGDQYRKGYATAYAGDAKVDIVILTHGKAEVTRRCFESIQEHTRNQYRVIWLDNGSQPEEVAAMKAVADKFETCELVPNETNLGFSKAANLGLLRSLSTGDASHVLLLNNDVIVTPGWLDRLLMVMEETGYAAVGPLTSEDNPHSLDALRPIVADLPTFNGEPPAVRAAKLEKQYGCRSLQSENILSFFCCLLKKSAVREVGQLDENLFCYGEDNDYCKRLVRKGHKLGIALGAYVHHDHRVTANSMGAGWVQEQQQKAVEYLKDKWKDIPAEAVVGPTWAN